MTPVIPISVGKKYKEFMDQLTVCATGNGKSVSSEVCKAIKFYMESFDKSPMIASEDKWNLFIKNASKEELFDMNTLIFDINTRVMEAWKSRN